MQARAQVGSRRSWLVGALVVVPLAALGGTKSPQQSESLPRFDVVSVKIDPPSGGTLDSATGRVVMIPGPAVTQPRFISPDTWTCTRQPVSRILTIAFELSANQIVGMPDWAGHTFIEIQGKLPAGAEHSQLPRMLQAMFADRFKMVTHHDSQVMDVRWVEVAKGGAKLQPAVHPCSDDPNIPHADTCCILPPYLICESGVELRGAPFDCLAKPVPRCGDVARGSDMKERNNLDFSGVGATMADLIHLLNATTSGAPFVDHTGLQGKFDFLIKADMTPPPAPTDDGGQAAPRPAGDVQDQMRVATERAFRDQAGLEVNYRQTHKEPYPVLVIDHMEMPTGN